MSGKKFSPSLPFSVYSTRPNWKENYPEGLIDTSAKIPSLIGFFINKPGYLTAEAQNKSMFVCIADPTVRKRADNFSRLACILKHC